MPHAAGDPLVVETASGAVRGVERAGLRSWRGIPYAADTGGANRFRAPQPVEPWEGVRDALSFGDAAPQHENKAIRLPEGVGQSEDCLSLNVLAPPASPETPDGGDAGLPALKPVMVWIHGGAYVAGSSAQPLFDGTHLVQNGDVVYVTVNYRLGALGFLDFSSLGIGAETNLGLRDILAALAWVQQNIAAFGGDPANVTLFGESAGAGCVTTLLASPAAEGLFHRAIAESSPVTSVYGADRAARVAAQLLELAGIPDEPARLRELAPAALSQAAFQLVAAVSAASPGTLAIGPVVDGDLVPEHPVDAFREGRQLRVPLIIGTNHDEASLFRLMKSPLMPITATSVHAMFAELAAEHPEQPELAGAEQRIERAYPHYPHRHTPAELSRDAGFRMPSIWLAAAHSRVAPTRMYRFDHATPMLKLLGIGATHGAEIAYVFGNFGLMKNDPSFRLGGLAEAERLSAALQARWVGFARDGEPQNAGDPEWPLYDEDARRTLLVGDGETVVGDPDSAIRAAWGDEVIGFD